MSAPAPTRSHWRRLAGQLFGDWRAAATSLACLACLAWSAPGVIRFLFIDAVWSARDGAPCRAPGAGACWAFVARKIDYFRYGSYPLDLRWRVDLTLMVGAVLAARLLWRGRPGLAFALAVPVIAFCVAPGPSTVFDAPGRAVLPLAAGLVLAGLFSAPAFGRRAAAIGFFLIYPAAAFLLLRGAPALGLASAPTNLWGGVFVTLLIAVVGVIGSFPIGVALALARRSRLPLVRLIAVAFIEVARGAPLIAVLFFANVMLPLFTPSAMTPDRFVRPLVAITLFAAAYMAEIVRGGLQSVPRGQSEAALSLGLSRWRTLRLVVLPQATAAATPAIVGAFIGLFKDTTLVASVGVFDFLRTVDSARVDPAWRGPTTAVTAYLFAALFYWAVCFGMSRYSLRIERGYGRSGHGA